jgi:hypothetical protein
MHSKRPPEGDLSNLTDRNHSNSPSIARHHTLAEERALIVTGRDSVPVAISIAVAVPVAASGPGSTEALSALSWVAAAREVTAREVATASTTEAVAPESPLRRSRVLS